MQPWKTACAKVIGCVCRNSIGSCGVAQGITFPITSNSPSVILGSPGWRLTSTAATVRLLLWMWARTHAARLLTCSWLDTFVIIFSPGQFHKFWESFYHHSFDFSLLYCPESLLQWRLHWLHVKIILQNELKNKQGHPKKRLDLLPINFCSFKGVILAIPPAST